MAAELQGGGRPARHEATQPVGQVPGQRVGVEGDKLLPPVSYPPSSHSRCYRRTPGQAWEYSTKFAVLSTTLDHLVCIMVNQSRGHFEFHGVLKQITQMTLIPLITQFFDGTVNNH